MIVTYKYKVYRNLLFFIRHEEGIISFLIAMRNCNTYFVIRSRSPREIRL